MFLIFIFFYFYYSLRFKCGINSVRTLSFIKILILTRDFQWIILLNLIFIFLLVVIVEFCFLNVYFFVNLKILVWFIQDIHSTLKSLHSFLLSFFNFLHFSFPLKTSSLLLHLFLFLEKSFLKPGDFALE
jgi:hypothetical protein